MSASDDEELTAEITAQVEEWSSNSNDCFTVLLQNGTSTVSFNPSFTYEIFGEQESIFGYKDLDITLSFRAHDLQPHFAFAYSKAFQQQGSEIKPTDINEAIRDFLPESAFVDSLEEDAEASSWKPPGEKIHSYSRGSDKFEIWCASLADSRAKQLLENMQILVPMLIEGGSALQLEQAWTVARWKLFLVYQVSEPEPSGSPYSLVGYGTSYRVFSFPDRNHTSQLEIVDSMQDIPFEVLVPPPNPGDETTNPPWDEAQLQNKPTPLDMPSRERISQFLILPPFHGSGHGQELYDTMYRHLTSFENVKELTVEDPNEAFDDLRDICDLIYLRKNVPEFAALRINVDVPSEKLQQTTVIPTDTIVDGAVRAKIMRETKIMQRQFDRLVEMHTLSYIPTMHRNRNRITRREKSSNEHDRAYYFWRLYAKQRLYIFNRDQLAQLDREERVEKLEAALDSVQEAYVKMLDVVTARAGVGNGTFVSEKQLVCRGSKRKIIEDDEDDSLVGAEDAGPESATAEVEPAQTNGSKKAKIS